MKPIWVTLPVLAGVAATLALASTCNGQIDGGGPAGYLPDGGFKGVMGPGERCVGYDAAALPRYVDSVGYQGPPCLDPDPDAGPRTEFDRRDHYCLVWGETAFPTGWPAFGWCNHGDGGCKAHNTNYVGRDCLQGTEGDRYCAAWFAQYLRRPAAIDAYCGYNGLTQSGTCVAGAACPYLTFLCVKREGEDWHSELPCEVGPK